MSGKLYLFPTHLGDIELSRILPVFNIDLIESIKCFIVEDIRSARRFLKKCNNNINIDELHFFELNKRTETAEIRSFISPLLAGNDMGVISEAGCPAIADPGADVVAIAHQHDIQVVPLVGPSSVLLALMASGFNGQSFALMDTCRFPGTKNRICLKSKNEKFIRKIKRKSILRHPTEICRLLAIY